MYRKLHITCPEKRFGTKLSEKDFWTYETFSDFEPKIFGHWAKTFRQSRHTSIFPVQRNILRLKGFLWNVIMFTQKWEMTGEESLPTEGRIFVLYYFTEENNRCNGIAMFSVNMGARTDDRKYVKYVWRKTTLISTRFRGTKIINSNSNM